MNEVEKKNNFRLMGTLSMVFGIIAIVLSCIPFARLLVIVLGIAAIVLGAIDLDKISKDQSFKSTRGMAISGIVLGGLAVIFSMVMGIFGGLFLMNWMRGSGGHMMQNFRNF
jgi:uncharacterized membrane protein HdeD (DUF308 family)